MKRISIILTLAAMLSGVTTFAHGFTQDDDDNPYAPRRHHNGPALADPYVFRQAPQDDSQDSGRRDRMLERQRQENDSYRNDGKSQLQRNNEFDRRRSQK